MARHLRGVQVRGLASGRVVRLGPQSVRAVGFDPELPLLPWPKFAPPGYRYLQEYFALPQKFLFFEVRGLDAVAAPEELFEIALQFERPPQLPARIGKDTLRLNCVPAVNLFHTTSDPIPVHALGEEHLVRAAELPPGFCSCSLSWRTSPRRQATRRCVSAWCLELCTLRRCCGS